MLMKKLVSPFACALLALCLSSLPAFAQQTGTIEGKVTDANGGALPGVTVTAAGDVLPQSRVTVTNASGAYSFRLLPPGNYELTFALEGLETVQRAVRVVLDQVTRLDVTMQPQAIEEEVNVVATPSLVDTTSAELKTAIDDAVITQLPVGQDYRDLLKLIPGVQYTEDTVRGPSAGGSGQDNVYLFDGVNVGLPLFGNLSSEPSSHDIEQVAIVKGAAQATGFNRSGGFTINTVSRSGTEAYHGLLSYQIQTEGMTGERDTGLSTEFEEDQDWWVAGIGGPIVGDRLFFYASYYRPTSDRDNRSNLYGEVPNAEDVRDEFFGKLTFTPTSSVLLHGSYRDSQREETATGVTSETRAGSTSDGAEATLEIAILEGTWLVNDSSYLSFKVTDFANDSSSRPDNLLDLRIAADGSVGLDVANLDQQGFLEVPQPIAGQDNYNAFIDPIIQRYGFLENGVRVGGGRVGVGPQLNDQDFARESYEVSYDYLLGRHDLHFGYQWSSDSEDLSRTSNGWGTISVPGGRTTLPDGTPIFYLARFEQQSLLGANGELIPPIRSEFESQSFEINDVIRFDEWTINAGLLVSNDVLYGQGLRENSGNASGFELAPGNVYKMYEVDFEDMIQPRLGATWNYNGRDTVYASWARYYPAASSLPRAASWARNLRSTLEAAFDAQGNLIDIDPVASSSGKFFEEGLEPRSIEEFTIGHSREFSPRWSGRAYARYRYGSNFWEDTNNNARLAFLPPDDVPSELYIPNLDEFRSEVGGSSYVIAELDGAFTKYYEVGVESEWRGKNAFVKGSYVWSHYYGNFDQDNTTTANDDNVFIGSSFLADGAGRQLWNLREGNLRGDRRHQLKVYGYYTFNWPGSVGVYAIYQSGQPWETWDSEVYRNLTSSTSDVSRFAEPAGSRTTSAHYQLDLNYTHHFRIGGRYDIALRADLFNVFDRQTGYNIQNQRNSANFGEPRSFYDPRRLQLAVRFEF